MWPTHSHVCALGIEILYAKLDTCLPYRLKTSARTFAEIGEQSWVCKQPASKIFQFLLIIKNFVVSKMLTLVK